jgi:hypothetical protein
MKVPLMTDTARRGTLSIRSGYARQLETEKFTAKQLEQIEKWERPGKAGRKRGTKKTQATAAFAKEQLEQDVPLHIVTKRTNAKFGTDLSTDAIKKQVQRNYPTYKIKLGH